VNNGETVVKERIKSVLRFSRGKRKEAEITLFAPPVGKGYVFADPRQMGIEPGDTVFRHSSLSPDYVRKAAQA